MPLDASSLRLEQSREWKQSREAAAPGGNVAHGHDSQHQLPHSHSRRRRKALTTFRCGTAVYSRARHYWSLCAPVEPCMRYLILTLCCPIPGHECTRLPTLRFPPSPTSSSAKRHIARPRRHPTPHLLMMHRTRTNTCTIGRSARAHVRAEAAGTASVGRRGGSS